MRNFVSLTKKSVLWEELIFVMVDGIRQSISWWRQPKTALKDYGMGVITTISENPTFMNLKSTKSQTSTKTSKSVCHGTTSPYKCEVIALLTFSVISFNIGTSSRVNTSSVQGNSSLVSKTVRQR